MKGKKKMDYKNNGLACQCFKHAQYKSQRTVQSEGGCPELPTDSCIEVKNEINRNILSALC